MSTRVPERTCVGCRGRASKGALLRLVREAGGAVRVDASRSLPGRGAYVHRDRSCVELALRGGALSRALRVRLDEGGAATLMADIEGALRT